MGRFDFTWDDIAGSASLPSIESASLFALLRDRRPFHGAERNLRMPVLGQRRWWCDRRLWLILLLANVRHVCAMRSVDAQRSPAL